MDKKQLSALLTLLLFVGLICGVGLQPAFWKHLPLSSADRQLLDLLILDQNKLDQTMNASKSGSSLNDDSSQPKFFKATTSAVLRIVKPTATESATVSRIIDGDTIELSDGRTVRYIGIDTPETKHPNKAVQCFGKEASTYNSQLVMGKTIVIENDVSATDRYGRLLKYVWVDGELVNYRLVADGFALARSFPPDVAHQAAFLEAEQLARQQRLGLWNACY